MPKKTPFDKLGDILNIANQELENNGKQPLELVKYEEVSVPQLNKTNFDEHVLDDYTTSRKVLQDILEDSNKAIQSLLELALSGESARSYEVLGILFKTRSEVARDLLRLHELKITIDKTKLSSTEPLESKVKTINNIEEAIIFTGTTTEALNELEKIRNKNK